MPNMIFCKVTFYFKKEDEKKTAKEREKEYWDKFLMDSFKFLSRHKFTSECVKDRDTNRHKFTSECVKNRHTDRQTHVYFRICERQTLVKSVGGCSRNFRHTDPVRGKYVFVFGPYLPYLSANISFIGLQFVRLWRSPFSELPFIVVSLTKNILKRLFQTFLLFEIAKMIEQTEWIKHSTISRGQRCNERPLTRVSFATHTHTLSLSLSPSLKHTHTHTQSSVSVSFDKHWKTSNQNCKTSLHRITPFLKHSQHIPRVFLTTQTHTHTQNHSHTHTHIHNMHQIIFFFVTEFNLICFTTKQLIQKAG